IMLHKMLTALYFLLQVESVIKNVDQTLIREANLILEDAKKAIDNRTDLEGIFAIAKKIQAVNNTDVAVLSLD
ncbi:MAG: DUF2254 domain-containing protein, partial [Leeuwenhoekiella sp.]|nr:DUF2254 domain-containing protein [Leeuwenhoekiella sp.]